MGNAQIDTAQSKFGGASGLFDGTGDRLTVPDSSDWDFGTGQFTVDLWVRFASVTATGRAIFSMGSALYFTLYRQVDGVLYFLVDSGAVCEYAWTPSADTWYHIAIVRESTGTDATKIYIDGTQVETGTCATDITPGSGVVIGDRPVDLTQPFYGWMDEIRVSKGIARWTTNFTPSTAEYS